MAFNISGIFNNVSNNVNAADNTTGNTASNANSHVQNSKEVIEMLKNMLEGDILSGLVTDINDNNVTLQLGNGQKLLAQLANNQMVQIGQNMTFLLESNASDTITLKPLLQEQQQMYMINNALEAAGYPQTEDNVAIVKELINMNMPVNADTISDIIKNAIHFSEADINTIANLMKLDMPVTAENIAQFEAYKSYEHSIMGELNNFGSDISGTVSDLFNNGNYKDGIDILDNTVNMLYQNINEDGTVQSQNIYNSSDGAVKLAGETTNSSQALPSDELNSYMDSDIRGQLATTITDTFGTAADSLTAAIKNGNISTRDILAGINQLLKNQQAGIDGNEYSQLITSKEYGALLKQMTAETMMLTPAAIAQENSIKNFYKKLKNNIDSISESIQKSAAESPLAKNMAQIKSNIDFMNDLNKNMTFVQLPVKFTESAGNGDLYVFTNKKALKNGTDKISALLHLDMDNLGPMDIYVNLSGKNVSTNFCLESEEMLDFVYSHIDKLNERLTRLGYTAKFEMKLSQNADKGIDFVDGFINKDNPPVKISQYVFDIKA